MYRNLFHIILCVCVFGLSSCSVKPFLNENDRLVAKNNVKIVKEAEDVVKDPISASEIKPILRPKANGKFLGTRLPQYIYLSLMAKQDSSKFRDFLAKQFGSEPRYVDSVYIDRSVTNIENYLFNNGYFDGEVDYTVTEKGDIESIINYCVHPKNQHVFGQSAFEFADTSDFRDIILQNIKLNKYIKEGEAFSVDQFNLLRNQMVKNGLENGYFFFDKSSIYVEPDTLRQQGIADIYVVVENEEDSLYNKPTRIRNVYMKMGKGFNDSYSEPEEYNEKMFSQAKTSTVKPKILDRFILLEKGELYSRKKHLNTINKLYDLPIVKYANIDFQLANTEDLKEYSQDSLYLDVFIDATTHKQMSLTFEPTISEFEGPAVGAEITFQNRNIFGGGELFDFSVAGNLQSVNNSENENKLFGTQVFSVEPKIIFPRLLAMEKVFPTIYENTTNQRTSVGLTYSRQNYVELYEQDRFGLSQLWEWQGSPYNKHALSLIDVKLINLISTSDAYQGIIDTYPTLQYSLQDRFILGSNYTYTYSNKLKRQDKSYLNFTGTIDLSGNLAYLLTGTSTKDTLRLNNNDVSRYVRSLASFTYHTPFYGNKMEWVNHISGGYAQAIGAVKSIPAAKQFFLGGSRSMRAWRPRSIGPGSYIDEDVSPTQNVDLRGDVMMEFNSELRYPLTKLFGVPLNGALFTDVGNIWTLNEPDTTDGGREGTNLDGNFVDELGIGAGTGLRLDLGFLVFRGDFSWKLRDPALPESQRWVEQPITWRKMQFQLGIGYPFEY